MRNALTLSLPALALAAIACGPGADVDLGAPATEEGAIINGDACTVDDHPTAVAILVDATISLGGFGEQPIQTVVCTGTLIAPDTVLTAAHCLDASTLTMGFGEVTDERYYVSFEDDLTYLAEQQGQNVEFPEDAVEAVDWANHDQFDLQNFQGVAGPGDFYDIGVIFLSETVDDIDPSIVITREEAGQLEVGKDVRIAGWGQQTAEGGSFFEPPPPGSVGLKVCADSFINEVGATEFQVGGDSTTSRKCHGDSGGPTYMQIDTDLTNAERVVGITSHAYDQSDCEKGGVDTRVDAYLNWLDDKMVTGCEEGTRVWCEVDGVIPPSFYEPPPVEPEPGEGGDPEDPGLGFGGDGDSPFECACASSTSRSGLAGLLGLSLLFGLALRRRR